MHTAWPTPLGPPLTPPLHPSHGGLGEGCSLLQFTTPLTHLGHHKGLECSKPDTLTNTNHACTSTGHSTPTPAQRLEHPTCSRANLDLCPLGQPEVPSVEIWRHRGSALRYCTLKIYTPTTSILKHASIKKKHLHIDIVLVTAIFSIRPSGGRYPQHDNFTDMRSGWAHGHGPRVNEPHLFCLQALRLT